MGERWSRMIFSAARTCITPSIFDGLRYNAYVIYRSIVLDCFGLFWIISPDIRDGRSYTRAGVGGGRKMETYAPLLRSIRAVSNSNVRSGKPSHPPPTKVEGGYSIVH